MNDLRGLEGDNAKHGLMIAANIRRATPSMRRISPNILRLWILVKISLVSTTASENRYKQNKKNAHRTKR